MRPPDVPQLERTFVVPVENSRPEPVERQLFLFGVVAAPLLICFCHRALLQRVLALGPEAVARLDRLLIVGLCLSIVWVVWHSLRHSSYSLDVSPFARGALAAGALAGASTLAWLIAGAEGCGAQERWARRLGVVAHVVTLGVILLAFLRSVFSLDAVSNNWCFTVSFNALFHAVVQVFNGKGLLVDLPHQYGLYPHFLVPFLRMTGLGVLGFTVVMATLTAAFHGCLYYVLRRTVASPLVAGLACSSMIYANVLFMRSVSTKYFFQYHPLRTSVPGLSVLLTYHYFRGRSRGTYYLSFVTYAVAMLWNFETGFVVFVSRLLVL